VSNEWALCMTASINCYWQASLQSVISIFEGSLTRILQDTSRQSQGYKNPKLFRILWILWEITRGLGASSKR
jgi:hypothetical protein